jgi:hypothetical protein
VLIRLVLGEQERALQAAQKLSDVHVVSGERIP